MDEAGVSQFSLKTGTGIFYGILNGGMKNWDLISADRLFTYGMGVGIQKVVQGFIFQTDITENHVIHQFDYGTKWGYVFQRVKLGTGYQFANHLSLVAGVTFNLGHYTSEDRVYQDYIDYVNISRKYNTHFWPGFYTSVEF